MEAGLTDNCVKISYANRPLAKLPGRELFNRDFFNKEKFCWIGDYTSIFSYHFISSSNNQKHDTRFSTSTKYTTSISNRDHNFDVRGAAWFCRTEETTADVFFLLRTS
ncbi:unnamed protein product [Amoebophrya sp. A120]|nr:unnamed protein product [Amoebophrya sp. A120]|eukprot:GSA120T00023876001.1